MNTKQTKTDFLTNHWEPLITLLHVTLEVSSIDSSPVVPSPVQRARALLLLRAMGNLECSASEMEILDQHQAPDLSPQEMALRNPSIMGLRFPLGIERPLPEGYLYTLTGNKMVLWHPAARHRIAWHRIHPVRNAKGVYQEHSEWVPMFLGRMRSILADRVDSATAALASTQPD